MAATASAPIKVGNETAGTPAEMRYVARQPILNLRGHVHAYQLLFRDSPLSSFIQTAGSKPLMIDDFGGRFGEKAARTMLDNAVIFGLEWLTNGLSAFVRCTTETLSDDLVLVLEPSRTVLQIPGNLEYSEGLINTCFKLKSRGFRIALEDFNWATESAPLAQLADYLCVSLDNFGDKEQAYLSSLGGQRPTLVALRVDTQDAFQKACTAGFTLFQGMYFCNPVLLEKRTVPSNRLMHFDIVRELHHDPLDIKKVSQLVLRDASLTYRLLRLANSPLYGIQQEVRSIDSAIMIVGENRFRRMISLAVLSEFGKEAPSEILHMSLVRARFCELAAGLCGLDPAEQYLLGMLSLVPAMLLVPMELLTPALPLREEIREALHGKHNAERRMLSWLESHERADWASCDALLPADDRNGVKMFRCYGDALSWAATALQSSKC